MRVVWSFDSGNTISKLKETEASMIMSFDRLLRPSLWLYKKSSCFLRKRKKDLRNNDDSKTDLGTATISIGGTHQELGDDKHHQWKPYGR